MISQFNKYIYTTEARNRSVFSVHLVHRKEPKKIEVTEGHNSHSNEKQKKSFTYNSTSRKEEQFDQVNI